MYYMRNTNAHPQHISLQLVTYTAFNDANHYICIIAALVPTTDMPRCQEHPMSTWD